MPGWSHVFSSGGLPIQTWLTISSFSECKEAAVSSHYEKISHLATKLTPEESKNTLKLLNKLIAEELKRAYEKFVVVGIDMA